MKRVSIAMAAGALMASLCSGVAAAAPPDGASGTPTGGCPRGGQWRQGSPQPGHAGLAVDFNGDGSVCLFVSPDGGFTFIDNVVRN